MKTKKYLNRKNITNAVLAAVLLVVLFVPEVKALVIRGLIGTGIFNPSVNVEEKRLVKDLSHIKFKDPAGRVISLAELKGKVVFINFWATWCPPCLAEMPSINRFYQEFNKDSTVVFLMVEADNNLKKAQDYMKRKKYDLPIYSFASDLPEQIFKGTLPTTVVFDKQGRLSFHSEGAANYSSKRFTDFIKKLKTVD